MKGHVATKRGKFFPVVSVQDEVGRRKVVWHPGHATKKEAQKALNLILADIDRQVYERPEKRTIASYMGEWLEGRRGDLSPTTLNTYRMYVGRFIAPLPNVIDETGEPGLGAFRVQDVKPTHLRAFYARLQDRGLKPKTIQQVHRIIHKALKDAMEDGGLARNPADLARPGKGSDTENASAMMRTWTPSELREFLGYVREEPFYPAFYLAATTGMRRAEVLGLRWEDLNLEEGWLSVQQTLLAIDHRLELRPPKTKKSRRRVDLDEASVAVLREHRKAQPLGPGLVFTTASGSPIHPDHFSKTFDRVVREAGLRRIRLHDLRHTHASLALAAGVPLKVVSERLGHSTIAVTADIYSHVDPGLQREAAGKIAALVFPAATS